MNENPNLKRSYIVKESPLRIISKCKSHSKGTLISFLVGICLLFALLNWVPGLLSLVFPVTNIDLMSAQMTDADPLLLERMPSTPMVAIIYMLLFNGVFNLGECLYCLTYIRSRRVEYSSIFESFPYYLKTLAVYILQTIIIGVWTLFFIIPGVIAAINFSQAYYILADDPSKGVLQVLGESKIMMEGNRMAYVRLIITYVPYLMLSYIPAFIGASVAQSLSLTGLALIILDMICEIPVYAANGYMSLGRTVFYELLINRSFADFKYAGQEAFRELERNQDTTM